MMYLWSSHTVTTATDVKDAGSAPCKPRLLILMGIVHLGVHDGMERKQCVWAKEAEGVMGTREEAKGGSFKPTEPSGYINGSACQLAVLDSLSAQSPRKWAGPCAHVAWHVHTHTHTQLVLVCNIIVQPASHV